MPGKDPHFVTNRGSTFQGGTRLGLRGRARILNRPFRDAAEFFARDARIVAQGRSEFVAQGRSEFVAQGRSEFVAKDAENSSIRDAGIRRLRAQRIRRSGRGIVAQGRGFVARDAANSSPGTQRFVALKGR